MKLSNKKDNSGGELSRSLYDTCMFLTLLFCVMRACGDTNWSAMQIMMPMVIYFGFSLGVIAVVIVWFLIDRRRK